MPPSVRAPLARAVLIVMTMVVVASACTPGSPQQATSTEDDVVSAVSAGPPERAHVDLGLLPLIDVAPVYIGLEDGLFEAEGLDIEITEVQGGAASIPAMVGGELDIAFGAVPSMLSSSANGLDLRLIAEQNRASPGFSDISTLPDSGLEGDPIALEGKRLALNTFANTAELTARSVVKAAGGDFDEVELVEVPFPEMVPLLERGEVDAAFLVEPFTTIAKTTLDARSVADPYTGPTERLTVGSYTTTENFAANFPNTVRAFQRALIAATDIARNDPQRVIDVLPTYTTLDAEAAAAVVQPDFVARIDSRQIQRIVDLMVEHGFLMEPLDLDTLIVPSPPGDDEPSGEDSSDDAQPSERR
jgi:NitT/TauT family transport system substrate-binding protein